MIAADQPHSWITEHAALTLAGAELPWLAELRQTALARFEAIGLPGVRDEEWRYTNLRALKSSAFRTATPSTLTTQLPTTDNPRLVFVDGMLDAAASSALDISGIQIHSLSTALSNDTVARAFNTTLPQQPHGFTALNTAYCQDGYVIELSEGAVLDGIIEVYFVAQSADTVSHTRNLIIADANTQCTIVERHVGAPGMVYLSNSITEILAGDNAHIDHTKVQQESDDAFHCGGVFINQSANSQVKNHTISLSGLVTRNDLHGNLLGQGAHIEMNGLVLGQGRQHVDNNTQVNHAVAHCSSDEFYKTVLDDSARSVFRGRIVVAQDAQQTHADQQNNNLLLSRNAEANAKPQLEIYADDVKCSHGATVGQLDATSLFYLQSRGINKEQARALLTFAFANEVIERVQVNTVRDELTRLMAGELLNGLEDLI